MRRTWHDSLKAPASLIEDGLERKVKENYTFSATEALLFCKLTGRVKPTADDEVGVEDAQGRLVGTLLVIDSSWDHKAEWDAGDTLQHD